MCRALIGNFASYYRIPTLNGFDPLYKDERSLTTVRERIKADPFAAYKAYGVAWLVLQEEKDFSVVPDRGQNMQQLLIVPTTSKLVTKIVKLRQTPDPLAFANDDPRQALAHRAARGWGVGASPRRRQLYQRDAEFHQPAFPQALCGWTSTAHRHGFLGTPACPRPPRRARNPPGLRPALGSGMAHRLAVRAGSTGELCLHQPGRRS